MEQLRKQVYRAYRRLGVRRFLGVLAWCWFVPLLAALAVIAVDKFYPLGWSPFGWGAWGWLGGMAALGLVAAVLWVALTRRDPLGAAIEIDRRFGLKERVSSALAMPEEELQTEAGQALVNDAIRRVERIDVASQFSVVPPRRMLLPLVPAVAAVLVALLVSPAVVKNPAEATTEPPAVTKQVKKTTDEVRRKLAERRKEAKELGLKDAEQTFQKLEQVAKDTGKDPNTRKQALTELNDYAAQLEKRRQQVGGAEKVQEELKQLQKKVDRGPADNLANALAKGDFKKAAAELERLKGQIENSKLDEKQKQDLANQMDQIKQKIDEMAQKQQQVRENLQQQIDQMRQAGQGAEADKLQQQLDKLMQQAPQMQQMQDLAQKLGQCAQCMRDGQMDEAANAMNQIQKGLGDLQKQLDELKMLEDAMNEIAQAKNQMNCPNCGGMGCGQCQGQGDKPGFGMGPGRGQGARPEAETDSNSYDTQVKQKVERGAADVVDLVEGPNAKGQVQTEIQQQLEAAQRGRTDPLTNRRMPKKHRQHAREYFDRFREGQ
jgi:hypothetical protein